MHDRSGIESLNVAKIPQLRQRTRQSGVVSPLRLLSHSEVRTLSSPPCQCEPMATLQRVDFRARLGYTDMCQA